MTLELPLISLIEVGEEVSLIPRGAAPGDIAIVCDQPAIVDVRPDGTITGRSPGRARLRITMEPSITHEIPVHVVPIWSQPLPLRPERPRLRYTAAELAQRRQLLQQERLPGLGLHPRRMADAFRAKADAFADESALELVFDITGETFPLTLRYPFAQPAPLPQPYGFTDYPFWTRLSREIEQRLITLAMAYSLTGDARYAEKARGILLALIHWAKWQEYDKPTNNLSLPHFTMGAAIAYDELHDQLAEAERAEVRQAILRLGLRPMSSWLDQRLDHNIAVLMNAGMMLGALAIADEIPFAAKYYDRSRDGLAWYIGQREESAATEGLVYLSYAFNTILKVAAAARRAVGDDSLLQSPYLSGDLIDLFLYLWAGAGGYANLADARHEHDANILMLQLVNEFADPRAAWLVQQAADDPRQLFPHLQRDVAVPPLDQLDLPRSRHFQRIDWVALRSGWGDKDTLLAFIASPSESGHTHFDQNHFILNVAGDWLITDPGYQNYTPGPEHEFTNGTIGHNALLVNGEGQSVRGHGRIVRASLGDGLDVVCGDATAAYEGRLQRWHRHIVYVKPDYVLIFDEIIPADSADCISLLFHTDQSVSVGDRSLRVGERLEDGRTAVVVFTGPRAAVALQLQAGHAITLRHDQFPGAERFGTFLRAELTPATHHRVATVLRPHLDGAPAEPLAIALSGNTDDVRLVVHQPHGADEHRFVREDASEAPLRHSLVKRAGPTAPAQAHQKGSR